MPPRLAPHGHLTLQGHRGARGLWPENTLPGFAAAAALGVDGLELDVVLTADGVVVVTHDLTLDPDRTRGPDGAWLTGSPVAPRRLTAAALRAFDVGRARPGSAAAAAFPDQRPVDGTPIPALADVFAMPEAAGVTLEVELKTDPTQPDLSADPRALAETVVAVARAAGGLDRLALRAFDWRGLLHAGALFPQIPLTFLTDAETAAARGPWWGPGFESLPVPEAVRRAAGQCAAAWAPDHADLSSADVIAAHERGLRVLPWTVNAPEDVARMVALDVDGLCSDYPDRVAATLAAIRAR